MKYTFRIFLLVVLVAFSFSAYGQEITTYDTIIPNNNNLAPVVAATNMNVLYRGLDNPVQIAVPGNYDEILIECSGGKITGGDGKYIIKPGSEKNVIVSVYTINDEKVQDTNTFQFRVKSVPTPQITWYGRVSGQTVKPYSNTDYSNTCGGYGRSPLIPRMEDFDFAVYATIESFDIAYSINGKLIERKDNKGNQIPKDIETEISSLPHGTEIFFTNVSIICPGGDTRISSATFTIE